MSNSDYFFLIALGAITISRLILALPKRKKIWIGKFRVRHYMYAVLLLPLGFLLHNIFLYASGIGFLVDELPLVLFRGLGYRDEQWHGCDDYFTAWCVAGVLVGTCIMFFFRDYLVGLVA